MRCTAGPEKSWAHRHQTAEHRWYGFLLHGLEERAHQHGQDGIEKGETNKLTEGLFSRMCTLHVPGSQHAHQYDARSP